MNNNNSTHNNPMTFLYYLGSELWQGLMQHKIMTLSGVLCAIYLRLGFLDAHLPTINIPEWLLPFGWVAKGVCGAIGVLLVNKREIYMSWIKAKARYHYSKLFKKKR